MVVGALGDRRGDLVMREMRVSSLVPSPVPTLTTDGNSEFLMVSATTDTTSSTNT